MSERLIDLRSDTVTRPTPAMRRAMADAEVGDDVMGDDPTVKRLEATIAARLGKEAAMYVPSGTMSNQAAIRVHCRPGDEIICEQGAHIYRYEGGAPAALNGVTCKLLVGPRGILDRAHFEGQAQTENPNLPRSRLVLIENTHNRGGGSITPLPNIDRITAWAREQKLALHLDGARLFNAAVATGVPVERWARDFDSISICFSKGLGAPVGSCLIGSKEFIKEARRVRRIFGGAMRQSGILAAACLYALEHHVERMAEDHVRAQRLARALEATPGFDIRADEVETNILWIPIAPSLGTADALIAKFREQGILTLSSGPQVLRMCTHLDVNDDDIERVIHAIRHIQSKAS